MDNDLNISKIDTFKAVHKIVGDVPVMTIAGGTKQYFKDRDNSLSSSSANNFWEIKKAADNNQILGVLLADGLKAGIGYLQ